jgi:hypothetical protein
VDTLSTLPEVPAPLITGRTVFIGLSVTIEEAAEEAVITPEVLVPVTVKRKYCPTSADAGV